MSRCEESKIDAATTLNSSVELRSISIVELGARFLAPRTDETKLSYSLTFNELNWDGNDEQFVGVFGLEVLVTDAQTTPPAELASFHVSVNASYGVTAELSDDQLGNIPHFLGIVGWMQAWPYLRAEIQQLSTKLGFPPLTLPILLSGQTASIPVVRTSAPPGAPKGELS